MKPKLLACVACAIAVTTTAPAWAAALALPHGQPPAPGRPATLPDLSLETAAGPLPLSSLRGHWTWLFLGFANCPDICPMTLSYLAEQHKKLVRPEEVQVLFVSVDPARDTPATLDRYVRYFDPSFQAATGSRAAIDALVAALGTKYQILPAERPGGTYGVAHPNRVFAIDPAGRLAATYPPAGDGMVADFNGATPDAAATPSAPAAPAEWCSTPNLLMDRARGLGSGTSLIPTASPMRMWPLPVGTWLWMFHGNADLGSNVQGGTRGGLTWAAENWQMAMGSGRVGPGVLDLELMTSLEGLTLPPGGTPQLFQTGESYRFSPLIDAQHPHDLLMEAAARYTLPLDAATQAFVYGGPVGEPALGPAAFMHRPSAADNPWAPLAHHLQDSTHYVFGVATAGVRRGPFQVEGSIFNGREPDEYRFDLETAPWTSYSGRLSYAPDAHWTAQVSLGHLANPERLHLGDTDRATASVMTVQDLPWGQCSTQLTWGQNRELHPPLTDPLVHQSYGLETQLDVWSAWHLYGRYEVLDRDGLPPDPPLNHVLHRLDAITLGMVRDLGRWQHANLGLGADATLYGMDAQLQQTYGYSPVSFRVFLRLRPPEMAGSASILKND